MYVCPLSRATTCGDVLLALGMTGAVGVVCILAFPSCSYAGRRTSEPGPFWSRSGFCSAGGSRERGELALSAHVSGISGSLAGRKKPAFALRPTNSFTDACADNTRGRCIELDSDTDSPKTLRSRASLRSKGESRMRFGNFCGEGVLLSLLSSE